MSADVWQPIRPAKTFSSRARRHAEQTRVFSLVVVGHCDVAASRLEIDRGVDAECVCFDRKGQIENAIYIVAGHRAQQRTAGH